MAEFFWAKQSQGRATDGIPTHPCHYPVYRDCFWLTFITLFVELPIEMRLCGLKVLRGQ